MSNLLYGNETSRTALVTGSSLGIGRAIALMLGQMGHRVAINYRSHQDEAEELAEKIRAFGSEAMTVQADVSNKSDVVNMIAQTRTTLGAIEILINNAGIISDALLVRMKDEDFQRVIQTNLFGTYFCCKEVVPDMIRARWGRIVNISSVVGIVGNPGQSNYAASKAAIHGFSKTLGKELAKRNVTVNAVTPGYVHTKTTAFMSDAFRKQLIKRIPLGRLGTPADIAPLVAFLTTEGAKYITTQVISADGGLAG